MFGAQFQFMSTERSKQHSNKSWLISKLTADCIAWLLLFKSKAFYSVNSASIHKMNWQTLDQNIYNTQTWDFDKD